MLLWFVVWLVVWFVFTLLGIIIFFDQPVSRLDPVMNTFEPSRMGFDVANAMKWGWWKACIVATVISQAAFLATVLLGKKR